MIDYAQALQVHGLTVQASADVSPFALAEAAWLVRQVLPPRAARELGRGGIRLVVLGTAERVTDLPEMSTLTPKPWFDHRYRGFGPSVDIPIVVCSEEDLLDLPGDQDPGVSTCIHELAHAVAFGRPSLVPAIEVAYAESSASGRWRGTYASSNPGEYFAAGAQLWFDSACDSGVSAGVTTREELRAYDPALAALYADVFGDTPWRYRPPAGRTGHLAGFDRAAAPPFTAASPLDTPEYALPWAVSPPAASPATEEKGWIVFANHHGRPVDVAWVDHAGVRRHWHMLRRDEEVLQDVYAGHVWWVSEAGEDLGAVVARAGLSYVEIHAPPPPPLEDPWRFADDAHRLPWLEAPVASPFSDDLTWILVANNLDQTVTLEWIGFDGVRREMGTLEPGGRLVRDAYVGHVWAVRAGEVEVGVFRVGAGVGFVEVGGGG